MSEKAESGLRAMFAREWAERAPSRRVVLEDEAERALSERDAEIQRLNGFLNDPDYPPKYSRRLIAELKDEIQRQRERHRTTWTQLEQVTGLLNLVARRVRESGGVDRIILERIEATLSQQAEPSADPLTRFVEAVRECYQLASNYSGCLDSVDEQGGDDHEDPICAVYHRLYYAMFDGEKALEQARSSSREQAEPAPTQDDGRQAFQSYLNDCAAHGIEPSIVGAFHFAWKARRSQPIRMPPSPYTPDVEPESMTDYERGEAQGRCDMWAMVKELNADRPAQTEQQPVAIANKGEHAFWVKWTDEGRSLRGPGIKLYAAPIAQTAPQPEQSGLANLLRRVTDELDDLNSAWLEQADDCGEPDEEREFCDATQELIDEARAALSAQGESYE